MAAAQQEETALTVEVATTTTAAVAAEEVEAGEARRVLVVAQDPADGATTVATTGRRWPQLWGGAPEGGGTAQEAIQRWMAGSARPLHRQGRLLRSVFRLLYVLIVATLVCLTPEYGSFFLAERSLGPRHLKSQVRGIFMGAPVD